MTSRQVAIELLREARLAGKPDSDGGFSMWLSIAISVGKHYYPGRGLSDLLVPWFDGARPAAIDPFVVPSGTPLYELLTELGRLFEGGRIEANATDRKDQGAYFTPDLIASEILDQTLEAALLEGTPLRDLTICDPAAGTGAFLLPAFMKLSQLHSKAEPTRTDYYRSRLSVASLFAVDIDPLTVAVLRSFLWLLSGGHPSLHRVISTQVRCGDSLAGSTKTADAFLDAGIRWVQDFAGVMKNGGFSAVVGNPPWGTLRPMISRARGGELSKFDQVASAKNDYVLRVRTSKYFRNQGAGDADLYRLFLERSTQLLAARGVIGVLVPAAFLRTEGAGPLRRYLLDQGSYVSLIERINSDRSFDIHSMFRYVEIVWRRGSAAQEHNVSFGNPGITALSNKPVRMSSLFLRTVSKHDSGFPDVRTKPERDLLLRLTRSHRALAEQTSGPWNVRFRREIDVTRAAQRFVHSSGRALSPTKLDELDLAPLYEGRMVHQHDAYAKRYESGAGRSAKWSIALPDDKELVPQFFVPKSLLRHAFEGERAGFCDISGHANERTVLASVIPAGAVAGNKVPTISFDSDHSDLPYIWAAVANSFVIDWLMRRRVSTTINLFYWNQIPFPRIDPKSRIGQDLARYGRALSTWTDSDPLEQLVDRSFLRARIDALVAMSFGLSWSDVALILRDFPLLDRGQVGSPTRDLLEEAMAARPVFRVPAGSDLASIAYVPAEVSRSLKLRGKVGTKAWAS